MAENKKSFLMYVDLIHTVKKMPKEKIADLFLTILEYVNDENPVVEDLLVELVFEPIKHQLKRDLINWQQIKLDRAIAGRVGGIKSGIARSKAKQNEANEALASKTKQTKQTQANEAVNATVTVNVTATAISKQKVIEFLRGAAPISIPLYEIDTEADRLIKQYGHKKIGNLRALCNSWMENYQNAQTFEAPVKKMVL